MSRYVAISVELLRLQWGDVTDGVGAAMLLSYLFLAVNNTQERFSRLRDNREMVGFLHGSMPGNLYFHFASPP